MSRLQTSRMRSGSGRMPMKLDRAALGRAQRRQARLGGVEQDEILGQLAMQEARGIGAFGADHAEVGEGGDAIRNDRGHR